MGSETYFILNSSDLVANVSERLLRGYIYPTQTDSGRHELLHQQIRLGGETD
jgi:hypothetical protein